MFKNKEKPLSHDEARGYICCVCGKKVNSKTGGVKFVNQKLSNLVRQFVHNSYSVQNRFHPTAMCGTCRLTLCGFDKV